MGIWKDKSGLHQRASEPTIVEETLAELNQWENKWQGMTQRDIFREQVSTAEKIIELKEKLREEQGVLPSYDFRQRRSHIGH